jgi:hypothetical protein
MRRQALSSISSLVVTVAAVAANCVPTARAFAPLPRPDTPADTPSILRVADTGIDIVRMPTPSPPSVAQPPPLPALPERSPAPPPPQPAPIKTVEPLGRLIKLPVKIGALPSDPQKGWLGVSSDPLDLPLALALGLANANGALVVEATAGGPAGVAGVRFGDIIVGFNGRTIDTTEELRQRVASSTPGAEGALEIWRVMADDGDFLRTLRRLGEGGNAAIMHRLGRMYLGGIGVARDDVEAIGWFRKGAAAGSIDATTMLAICLLEGRGTGKDPQEGVYLLKAAAEKNNPEAMYRLGVLLVQGQVVGKDLQEAVRLLTKAAEAGLTPAMVDLGVMHQQGMGVPANLAAAVKWYKRAADLGNALGMMYLGVLYEHGKGVEQNSAAAVALYRKAADLGHPFGIHNLAGMLDKGRGVDRRDPEQAADLMMRALELGNQFSHQQMTKNSQAWTPEFRRALQRRLRDAGLFTGRIDGVIRGPTIEAIDAYFNRGKRQSERPQTYGAGGRSL